MEKQLRIQLLEFVVSEKRVQEIAFFCKKENSNKLCKNLKEVSLFFDMPLATIKNYSFRKKSNIKGKGIFFKVSIPEYLKKIIKEMKK